MNKLPIHKFQKSIVMLSLIIVSIACNIPDVFEAGYEAAREKCRVVSREEYEIITTQLGRTPETPKYPDSAVYEECLLRNEVTSIRMSDGYGSDDKKPTESVSKVSIPIGTYKGKIKDTEMATGGLLGEWKIQGTVEKNEIIINVAEDGSVTGKFTYEKIGNILLSDDDGGSHATCTDSNDQFFFGEATGQLLKNTGRIVFNIQHTFVKKLSDGCSIGPKEDTIVKDISQQFEIEITDAEMFGKSIPSTEYGHPVKATFVLVK